MSSGFEWAKSSEAFLLATRGRRHGNCSNMTMAPIPMGQTQCRQQPVSVQPSPSIRMDIDSTMMRMVRIDIFLSVCIIILVFGNNIDL